MGLDMYLTGEKFRAGRYKRKPAKMDGFVVEQHNLEIAYWRKHPDLHGYIVQNFGPKDADGNRIDDCEKIWLGVDSLTQIKGAILNDELPKTEGFFFGDSTHHKTPERIEEYANQIQAAIDWLLKYENSKYWWCNVYYTASW